MSAFSLRGAEIAGDIEHCRIANQQRRTGRHRFDTKLVVLENLGLERRISNVYLRIGLHNYPSHPRFEVCDPTT